MVEGSPGARSGKRPGRFLVPLPAGGFGAGESMIQVRQLAKHYFDLRLGRIEALRGISFDAYAGEIFGLLGANGAGKTTTLRILATLLQPSGGTATVGGYDVVRQPALVRRQIGYVSANTGVYDRMTAREMVEHFGRLYGLEQRVLCRRIDELFERLQMREIAELPGAKMSTGMKQKVSIARALVHDPPVLIFDEATVGLDVVVARSLLQIIGTLRESGKCIVFSTHIMREVERLCDRVGIIHHGRLLALGTLEELKRHYGHEDLEDLFYHLVAESGSGAARHEGELPAPEQASSLARSEAERPCDSV